MNNLDIDFTWSNAAEQSPFSLAGMDAEFEGAKDLCADFLVHSLKFRCDLKIRITAYKADACLRRAIGKSGGRLATEPREMNEMRVEFGCKCFDMDGMEAAVGILDGQLGLTRQLCAAFFFDCPDDAANHAMVKINISTRNKEPDTPENGA